MLLAAVCHRFGEPPRAEEVLLDPPGPDEVRIRVEASAICHSDVAYAAGAWGGDLPAVYGHEACGVVLESGPGATPAEGERVVVGLVRHCGHCERCRAGEPALCTTQFGLDDPRPTRRGGGGPRGPIRLADGRRVSQGMRCATFAQEAVVHASQVVAVPEDVPAESACLIACGVMTGIGAAQRSGAVEPGSFVVVIGAGGVGLNAIQGAVLAGAAEVVAVDIAPWKLATAAVFGATAGIDASQEDPVEGVLRMSGGRGADAVIATAGAARAIEQGLACLRRGGTLVAVGMPPTGQLATFDPAQLAHDGKRIVGSKLGSAVPADDVPRFAELYQRGELKLDELVTGTYPL